VAYLQRWGYDSTVCVNGTNTSARGPIASPGDEREESRVLYEHLEASASLHQRGKKAEVRHGREEGSYDEPRDNESKEETRVITLLLIVSLRKSHRRDSNRRWQAGTESVLTKDGKESRERKPRSILLSQTLAGRLDFFHVSRERERERDAELLVRVVEQLPLLAAEKRFFSAREPRYRDLSSVL